MSWSKRTQGGAVPPSGPDRQPFAAPQAQPFGNQENMYSNYQGMPGSMQPQQSWQMPPQQSRQPEYNQQYGQVFQQPDYPANANQFYPQQSYNMNYMSQGFNNSQQTNYPQQNYYQNQDQQQNITQTKPNIDSWEDNWSWGWGEDSSKQAQIASHPQNVVQQLPQQSVQHQQQVYNNANIIEQSFAQTDSNCWSWAMDDKKDSKENIALAPNNEATTSPVLNTATENITAPEYNAPRTASNMSAQQVEEVRTLNDKEVVKERLPNLALGKRFHLDNLTPQWSIESQMSQESSDGLHTQSEGTYRSETQSRNSNKSSPGLNIDSSNFNYSQVGLDDTITKTSEWSQPTNEPTLADGTQNHDRRVSHDELSNSMQQMKLTNRENLSTDSLHLTHDSVARNTQELIQVPQPPQSMSPSSFPAPVPTNLPPPPTMSMPPAPPVSSIHLPASNSSSVSLSAPPVSSSIPPPTSSSNPFKHAGPFSHKSLAKGSSNSASVQAFLSPPSTNLASPGAVNKVSQHNRVPVGFEANLETTPDNSERPDQPQVSAFRSSVSQQVPDNMEVAPRNDRNEYLQTAHLSSGDFMENTDFSRSVPPPGLRRMVVGQHESEYNQNLIISGDEPPPGLARMVPGQQTETDNGYNQPGDNYLDRHVDGQTTDSSTRPYRQADGQQTLDNYNQPPSGRVIERRPIGLDRMVPGEPSNDEYAQYQTSNYVGSNEQRVVTGLDHDFTIAGDAGPTDVREQNVDGSDYTEQNLRNPPRNIIGVRENSNDVTPDFSAPPDDQQREVTVGGETTEDFSIISTSDITYSREQVLDGADLVLTDGNDRKTDFSDSIDHHATSSRRQSLNRVNTSGEDSERDRTFKSSPRRDKHKSSRDRDRERGQDREKDRERDRDRGKDGRYYRGDSKYDTDRRSTRDDRRSEKDRRDRDGHRDRDENPDTRRYRRSTRSRRYETEDTDYYSDKERNRRRHRESSYTSSKPPRPDDKERLYDERDRSKRYNTIERERRYDDERESRRRSDRYRERDPYQYRDIDPTRKHGNIRRQRENEDPRRGEYSPSRAGSRDATDEDGASPRRRDRRSRRTAEPFYDEYAGGGGGAYAEAYLAQRQQYQYYEHLRLSNPAAYMALYKQIMAGHAPHLPTAYAHDFTSIQYDGRQERGSVHSGRSSTTGIKGNETYYSVYRGERTASLRDAPSLRTDLSDRELTRDTSPLEGAARSDRMTPCRYSTAHVKGSLSSRDLVVVRPSYPVDGAPATVLVLSLAAALAHHPHSAELAAFPGPLVKGVTHKKSVMQYCAARVQGAAREGTRDPAGYVLLWELLALTLRHNGVVVGSDIAELLMKNTQEYEFKSHINKTHNESGRGSSVSCEGREANSSPEQASLSVSDNINPESFSSPSQAATDERQALDRLRELLTYGNRQEAIEWAMSSGLWAHALTLAAHAERRTRAAVAARFVAALPRKDTLHTLYASLAAATPPAAACVSEEGWGDWRPHAAILLANPTARPDHDKRTLIQLGDSLSSRGLLYSAQFCYVSAGVQFSRHPLAPLPSVGPAPTAPPRLSLLLADPRSTSLAQLATNKALFATEVYEYALSLSQEDFVITELQPYKLVVACRLADCGQYERALAYTEAAARAVTRAPAHYSPALVARLATLADRLKYHDPALHDDPPLMEETDSAEPSPRHHQQWLDDVKNAAHMLTAENTAPLSRHTSPAHTYPTQQQLGWSEQTVQQYQQTPVPSYMEPAVEEMPELVPQYYAPQPVPEQPPAPMDQQYPQYEEWGRQEEQHQQYADPYWQNDHSYTGYGDGALSAEENRPSITMPGASRPRASTLDYDDDRPPSSQNERDTDTPKTAAKKQEAKTKDESKSDSKGGKGGGWLGGILNKLSLRAPNQMILPDDKNPSIVWDAETKRWRNVDGTGDESDLPPPPPPKTQDLPHVMQSASPQLPLAVPAGMPPPVAPAAPVSNIFKMQKGRHIKKSYVDVFNPSGAQGRVGPPAAVLGPAAPPPAPSHYFVPAPPPQGGENDLIPDAIQVSIPPSPESTPSPTPRPLIYDKNDHDTDMYHSGI